MATHWDDRDEGRQRTYLQGLAGQAEGVPTDITTVNVHPNAPAIEQLTSDDPNRIVCMTSHGRGRLSWAVLGSVAEEVVRESRRPTVVVGRHCRDGWPGHARHVLVCVNGTSVAEPVIPVAVQWAKALHLDVQVAVVVHPLDLEVGGFPHDVVDAIVARLAADGVNATPVALRGSYTAGAIADYVSDSPVALVAMNTHARGGLARAALGSVAMGTVGLVECPVLLAPMADRQD
jgi:nucleotide-binding universal stress UspA family protein